MNVITLGQQQFDDACAQLSGLVFSSGFSPELIVAIASGGVAVADAFCRIPHLHGIARCDVICRRNSTRLKDRFGFGLLAKRFPVVMSDLLRSLEHRATRLLRGRGRSRRAISIPPEALARMKTARRILILDDAVDSGSTLLTVMEAIRAHNRDADIRAAVITTTLRNPLVVPDYSLYSSVLVRFPWSADAH